MDVGVIGWRDDYWDHAAARSFHRWDGFVFTWTIAKGRAGSDIDRGGIGIGAQCWELKKKLLEIDELMTPAKQRTVHEVHPEVSFSEMNGGRPSMYKKKSSDGRHERVSALRHGGLPEAFLTPLSTIRSGRDDFLDACAALWTAERI